MPVIEELTAKYIAEVDEQIAAIQPRYQEALAAMESIQGEMDELNGLKARLSGTTARGRRSTRATGATTTPAARRTGTSTGGGTRAQSGKREQEFLDFVRENPGTTIPDVVKATGLSQNYLYRVRDNAVDKGLVRKDGNKYFIAEASAASEAEAQEPVAA